MVNFPSRLVEKNLPKGSALVKHVFILQPKSHPNRVILNIANGNILHFPNEDAAIYVTKLEEVKNNLSKKGNTKMIQSSKLKEVQAHYEGNVELLTSSHRDRDIDEVKRKMYYCIVAKEKTIKIVHCFEYAKGVINYRLLSRFIFEREYEAYAYAKSLAQNTNYTLDIPDTTLLD